jgi:molybdopterin-synthase adenylyltransferase
MTSTLQAFAPSLAARRAVIVGVGGLGSPAALALARAGVGRVDLIDDDVVDVSNLHRQTLYATADVGAPKVLAAAARLRAVAPGLRVDGRRERFTAAHAPWLRGADVVLDGTDTVATKFLVNDAAVAAGTPLVHAGVLGFQAQVMTVLPGVTACYRCVFEEAPPEGEVPSCSEAGVVGPTVALAGALQAVEALRLLGGLAPALAGRLLALDTRARRHRLVQLTPNPRCPACAGLRDSIGRRSDLP